MSGKRGVVVPTYEHSCRSAGYSHGPPLPTVGPRAVVRERAVQIDGDLSKQAFRTVMGRKMKAICNCYFTRVVERGRRVGGTLVFRFDIGEDGRTRNLELEDHVGSPELTSCLAHRARAWRFPRPRSGFASVTYPLAFRRVD